MTDRSIFEYFKIAVLDFDVWLEVHAGHPVRDFEGWCKICELCNEVYMYGEPSDERAT